MRVAKINSKNLKRICGLNGKKVRDLAEEMGVSSTLLYRACHDPKKYAKRFQQMNALLPVRGLALPAHD